MSGNNLEDYVECHGYVRKLRKEMDLWLDQSIELDPVGPYGGGEDEANYTLAWFPHYLVTGNLKVIRHFEYLKDVMADWVKRECFHGYQPEQDMHHGPEPFLLFLPRYINLRPGDKEAISILDDAAEHIGNWVQAEGVSPWYDYEGDGFFSLRIGSRKVKRESEIAVDTADHMRFIHMAIASHRVTGKERYLDWALRYGRVWANRIINAETPMPLGWRKDGTVVHAKDIKPKLIPRGRPDKTVNAFRHPLKGIENLIGSGAVYVFGDLFQLSGDKKFQDAAKRIIEPLIAKLLDPYCDPGAAALLYYRWAFNDDSFDGQIRDLIDKVPDSPPEKLALVFPEERNQKDVIGYRWDMALWGEWLGESNVRPIKEPSTAFLALVYQLTGNIDFAKRAFRSASTRLAMAREVLRGGREHSDMGGAICSVAAGHGRNWGQGAVTGCYGPLLLGTHEVKGKVTPQLEVKGKNEEICLPDELLTLVRSNPGQKDGITFFNGGDSPLFLSWRFIPEENKEWNELDLSPGEIKQLRVNEGL